MAGADLDPVGLAYCGARSPLNQAVDALGGLSIDEGGIFLIFLIHSAARCSDLSSCSMVTCKACLAAELTCVLARAELGVPQLPEQEGHFVGQGIGSQFLSVQRWRVLGEPRPHARDMFEIGSPDLRLNALGEGNGSARHLNGFSIVSCPSIIWRS
jgi:hypothetical protein